MCETLSSVHVRYINLDRRLDRHYNVIEKLALLGFNRDNVKRFSAMDASKLKDDIIQKGYQKDELIVGLSNRYQGVKTACLACLLSHYLLPLEIAHDDSIGDDNLIFIFEDDFNIDIDYLETTPFVEIIKQIVDFKSEKEWDILYLGGRFKPGFIPENLELNTFFMNSSVTPTLNKQSCNHFYKRIAGKGIIWDRTLHAYVTIKRNAINISNAIKEFMLNPMNELREVDHLLQNVPVMRNYDYFPHIFYSPSNIGSDIQGNEMYMNTHDLL